MASITLAKVAELDLWDAFIHYEAKRPTLGEILESEVYMALETILKDPELHPFKIGNFRALVIKRFPFSIYYHYDNQVDTIYVVAIWAHKRNPSALKNRISP